MTETVSNKEVSLGFPAGSRPYVPVSGLRDPLTSTPVHDTVRHTGFYACQAR